MMFSSPNESKSPPKEPKEETRSLFSRIVFPTSQINQQNPKRDISPTKKMLLKTNTGYQEPQEAGYLEMFHYIIVENKNFLELKMFLWVMKRKEIILESKELF